MKKRILVLVILATLITFPFCNFNGKAKVIVKNIGELTLEVKIDQATSTLYPGMQDEFTITWPGKNDANLNLSYYAKAYATILWDSINFWIKDGETKIYELEYYKPELTE